MLGLWSTAFLLIAMAFTVTAPAVAQNTLKTQDCTAANIASTAEAIGKMKDSKQKTTATEEIDAASAALAGGKTEECQVHLLKAALQTK